MKPCLRLESVSGFFLVFSLRSGVLNAFPREVQSWELLKDSFRISVAQKKLEFDHSFFGDHFFKSSLVRRSIGGYLMHDCLPLLWSSHLCGHACAAAEYRFLYCDFHSDAILPWGREAHLLLAKWSRRDK